MPEPYDEKNYCHANEPQRRPDLQCNPSQAYTYYQSQACVENDPYWEEYWQGHEERLRTGGAPQTPSPEVANAQEAANAQEVGSAPETANAQETANAPETGNAQAHSLGEDTECRGGPVANETSTPKQQSRRNCKKPTGRYARMIHVNKKNEKPKYVYSYKKANGVNANIKNIEVPIPTNTVIEIKEETTKGAMVLFYGKTIFVDKADYTVENVQSPNEVKLDRSLQGENSSHIATTIINVRLRQCASKRSKQVAEIPKSTDLPVLDTVSDAKITWYCVNYNGISGYVMASELGKSAEITDEQGKVLVQNARNCLGQVTRDLPKSCNEDFAGFNAGGYDKNCANFVSYMLRTVGILNANVPGCAKLRETLAALGWQSVKVSDALKKEVLPKPGDVWFSNDGGHTELVTGVEKNEDGKLKLKVIGSNNVGNVQVVTEVPKTDGTVWSRHLTE